MSQAPALLGGGGGWSSGWGFSLEAIVSELRRGLEGLES